MLLKHSAWLVISFLIIVDVLWLALSSMSVAMTPIVISVALTGGLVALTALYTHIRPDERLAGLTDNFAKLFSYSVSLAVFGYLVTSLNRPLADEWLNRADNMVGFNWPALYAWVKEHEFVKTILIGSYNSVILQIGVLMTLLITWRQFDRARSLLWIYIISSLIYVLISALLPAAGAFGYYHTALDTTYLQQFYALRNGTLKDLDLRQLQGVVQFPSFHLALAIICTYAARGIRFLFPSLLVLNLLVIASTPAIGGHFFADLWVSALLMGVIIFFVERRLSKRALPECLEEKKTN